MRVETGTELSPVAHAEFQAALYSARKYLEMRHGGSERLTITGALSCAGCGQVFAAHEDGSVPATELSARLLGHACNGGSQAAGPAAAIVPSRRSGESQDPAPQSG